ncbi:MAG TPA: porin [Fibrobacteria bacterium]|nr:porin [Fibrobacteria bacterium]
MKSKAITLPLALAAIASAESTPNLGEKLDAVEGKLGSLEENYLETKSTVAALAKLKISGLVQAQVQYFADTNILSSSGTPTARSGQQTQFMVRRGRLKATYDAGNGSQWVMQYNLNQSGLSAQDMYVKWEEPWLKTFSVQAGLQDIPFGYEIGYSSSSMEWLERSRFERSAMFKDEKDVGFVLGASPKVPGLDAASLKIAALNGYGAADATMDPASFTARANIAKNLPEAGLGLALGGSYYMDKRLALSTTKNAKGDKDSLYVGESWKIDGRTSDIRTRSYRKELDASIVGADAQITWDDSFVPTLAGLKVLGELYTGTAVGGAGGNTRTNSGDVLYQRDVLGWYVAAVQNFDKVAQLVVRYDAYDPNTNVSGDEIGRKGPDGKTVSNGTSKADLAYGSWYFGLNVFLNGNTKLSIGYDLIENETSSSLKNTTVAASDFSKDVDDDVLTVRGQFSF